MWLHPLRLSKNNVMVSHIMSCPQPCLHPKINITISEGRGVRNLFIYYSKKKKLNE